MARHYSLTVAVEDTEERVLTIRPKRVDDAAAVLIDFGVRLTLALARLDAVARVGANDFQRKGHLRRLLHDAHLGTARA